MEGIIVKGVGGFYTVETADGEQHVCRARGRFRSEGIKPLVGDVVDITPPTGTQEGRIDAIRPRRNEWKRPPVANIDSLVAVLSGSWPKPDLLLYDKLLINAALKGVPAVICVSKLDEAKEEDVCLLREEYGAAGTRMLCTSARTGEGLDALRSTLTDGISGFAGQSGVGKSSLLNALAPEFALETGGRAAKVERGRHTTRHVELLRLPDGGRVVDTPGFSLLETEDIPSQDLAACYPEFARHIGRCAFSACLHRGEPGCAVKAAADAGEVPRGRYERYVQILQILEENRRKRYD